MYSKKRYTKSLLEETKTYHASVSQSLADIEERSALLDNGRGRDAYLREKEGLLLPGEEVYVIVDTPKVHASSTSLVKKSWLQRLIPFY